MPFNEGQPFCYRTILYNLTRGKPFSHGILPYNEWPAFSCTLSPSNEWSASPFESVFFINGETGEWIRLSRGSFPNDDEATPATGLQNLEDSPTRTWQMVGTTRSWEDQPVSEELKDKIVYALRNCVLTQVAVTCLAGAAINCHSCGMFNCSYM
jgi:hypothetical protein